MTEPDGLRILRYVAPRRDHPRELEFGTFLPMKVFRAMQAENWLHHHGGWSHPWASVVKAQFRRAFYPDAGNTEWRERFWSKPQIK